MDDSTIIAVVSEIAPLLIGRAPGKIFQLGAQSLAIDFGLRREGYLFVSVNPTEPRLYLIKRKVRDLEKQSVPLSNFGLMMRKELAHSRILSIEKVSGDRIVVLKFEGADELGRLSKRGLIVQLTGRSANLLLVDEADRILAELRAGQGAGQVPGDRYQAPQVPHRGLIKNNPPIEPENDPHITSESLDLYYTQRALDQARQSLVSKARARLRSEISRRRKLLKQLEEDLSEHANAEKEKLVGDLLLANVGTARRLGNRVKLNDYFTEGAPEIEIEVDEKTTIPEEASRRFAMYARSKRARKQIASRTAQVKTEIDELEERCEQLDTGNDLELAAPGSESVRGAKAPAPNVKRIPGTRRYLSSDDFEILVGRAARDNDHLTFKVAKPNDLWLHAADYPGSHVIVRRPSRKEIPHRTIIEAAQLAAFFSRAKRDPKVDVHYAERKFVSKLKGAAPGLVRLARFKTITASPIEAGRRVA